MKLYLIIFVLIFILYITNTSNKKTCIEKFTHAVVNWDEIGGEINQVSIGENGNIIARSYRNQFFKYDNDKKEWNDMNKKFKYLSIKDNNSIVGINSSNESLEFSSNGGTMWEKLPDNPEGRIFNTVSIGNDNTIAGTTISNSRIRNVYIYDGESKKWNLIGDKYMRQIDIRNKNEIWGITFDYKINRWSKRSGWRELEGSAKHVSVGKDGTVWCINKEGEIFRLHDMGGWQLMKGPKAKSISVRDNNNIVIIAENNKAYMGRVREFPSVPDPIETKFKITAYSEGLNAYNRIGDQNKNWETRVILNGRILLGFTDEALKIPQKGFNVIGITNTGDIKLNENYKTNENVDDSNRLVSDAKDLLKDKSTNLVLFVVHYNAVGKISNGMYDYLTILGASKIKNMKKNNSYIFAYDNVDKIPLFESLESNKINVFHSEGKQPVIDASVDNVKKEEKYLFHNDSSVHWNIVEKKIAPNGVRDLKDWPIGLVEPFNRKIDASFNYKDSSIILTRNRLWILYDLKSNSVVDGPNFIGEGIFPLREAIVNEGINAAIRVKDYVYMFVNKNWIKVNSGLSQIESNGIIGTGEWLGIPKPFADGIDAIVAKEYSNKEFYLFSGDKWLLYNLDTREIVEGPDSLIYHPKFNRLPLSYRTGIVKPPQPFLNHTRFKGNILSSYDITVREGLGFPGWTQELIGEFNYNFYEPPINTTDYKTKVKSLADKSVNELLTHYHTVGRKDKKLDINKFGGNTISFSLLDKNQPSREGYWLSTSGNANMQKGALYTFSIWVRTSDKSGLETSVIVGRLADDNILNSKIVKINDGWQRLSWTFQNKIDSNARNINIYLKQLSNQNSIHALYGPTLMEVAVYPNKDYIESLLNMPYVYIKKSNNGKYLGASNDPKNLYLCDGPSCGTFNGEKKYYERWSIYRGKEPNSYILSSYGHYLGGSLNVGINADNVSYLSKTLEDDQMFKILINTRNKGTEKETTNLLFLNSKTNTLLGLGEGILPTGDTQDAEWMLEYGEGFEASIEPAYIEAAVSSSYGSNKMILFRNQNMMMYDVNKNIIIQNPITLQEYSKFSKLPAPFNSGIDSAISRRKGSSHVYLFKNDKWIRWDVTKGTYFNDKPEYARVNRRGTGGHKWFSKMPSPFSKKIDAAFNIGDNKAILISGNEWIRWNLLEDKIIGYVEKLGTDWSKKLSGSFLKRIDSAVDIMDGKQVYLFCGSKWLLLNLESGNILDGPKILGTSNVIFSRLPFIFRPSDEEKCNSYRDVIKLHTMNTESKCSSNEDSEYPWLDFCVDVPLCNSLGGNYVDGVCVDSVNKKPIKSINEEIKNNYTTKYWQECKKVSWTNYDNMVKNEQRKYQEKDNELNNEINQKDDILNRIVEGREKIRKYEGILQRDQNRLKDEQKLACSPHEICVSKVEKDRVIRNVPRSCNRKFVKGIREKGKLDNTDKQLLMDKIKGLNINNFSISEHPDFQNLVKVSDIESCNN